jgi:hypothetical protein
MPAAASVPFRAADHLHDDKDIAMYIQAMLEDGDVRAIPAALRTLADAGCRRFVGSRKRFQRVPYGTQKRRRMDDRNVIDLRVVQLRIAMRENVAKPDDVAGVGNLAGNSGDLLLLM